MDKMLTGRGGWDWGPLLITCGPWRETRLEIYEARLTDLRVDYEVASDLKSVKGSISAFVEGSAGKMVEISAWMNDGSAMVFKGTADVDDEGLAKVDFHVNDPSLWYPHGYGKQFLYDVRATVSNGDVELHTISRRTGFRKLQLIQERDKIGKSFYFRVNNIDIFCGGSDWIPADSFTPRISADRYRKWLQMMVDGYQVMIRFVLARQGLSTETADLI